MNEKIIKKETKKVFNKNNYLLGKRNGVKIWLEEASWNCNWYWDFGYIEEYNKKYTDINSHTHFSKFLNGEYIEGFKKQFDGVTLCDADLWKLFEYMKQFYILREYADTMYRSGANYTTVDNLKKHKIENIAEYERINKILLPELFQKIYKLLSE